MRRILLRFWVFGLAFGLGICVSELRRLYWLHQLPPVSDVVITISAPPEDRPLRIVSAFDACGPTANYHTFNVSDGSQITTSCESYASSAAAARALRARLGKAQVAEHFETLNEAGRRESETFLVTTPTVIRLSTHGRSLCVIEAPTLKHLQLFGG